MMHIRIGSSFRILLLGCVAVLALASCANKDLCYDHPHAPAMWVSFDWTKSPEAAPSLMEVWFYPVQGGLPYRYQIPGKDGGEIRIPAGQYKALCYNGDSEIVLNQDTGSFETHLMTTSTSAVISKVSFSEAFTTAPKAPGTEDQQFIFEPDFMYSGRLFDVSVSSDQDSGSVTFEMEPNVVEVSVVIKGVPNLDYVDMISGALSGMSSGWYIGPGVLKNDHNIIALDVERSGDSELSARFRTFGHCPDETGEHVFSLYVIMTDGRKYAYNFNVADQLHDKGQDPRVIEILLEDIPIPTPITSGGLNPEVSEWDEEIIYL